MLTTHTGSLPRNRQGRRTAARRTSRAGQRKTRMTAAVREAVAYVRQQAIECGSTSSMTANR